MQIPKSKYVSLDNVNDKPYNRSNQHLNQSERWPNFTTQSLANTSTRTECWRTLTKSVADFLDTRDDVTSSSNDLANNLDANNCAECLKNNFWIKPVTGENYSNQSCKKKRTTFRTDSSLLIIHNLSSSSDNIDSKSIPDIDTGCQSTKSIADSQLKKINSIDTEEAIIKTNNIDLTSIKIDSNRNDIDKIDDRDDRRRENEQLVLTQLSKIIRILEKKDLT
ncbi:PREDICTED: uncharacterized protein LOC106103928 [Papilio polytes]|uniref:uncharacterized protein LOC106103928 n=1 Tax=Papilio polytes TaxID=76194 RepID=UPI0006763F45|nr:PREDICTED: uncharacterized protein LOC106103928 [Papilio polytes]